MRRSIVTSVTAIGMWLPIALLLSKDLWLLLFVAVIAVGGYYGRLQARSLFTPLVAFALLSLVLAIALKLTSSLEVSGPVIIALVCLICFGIGTLERRVSIIRHRSDDVILAIIALPFAIAFSRMSWSSLDGLDEMTRRSGDNASFLIGYFHAWTGDGTQFSGSVGLSGGPLLGLIITISRQLFTSINSGMNDLSFHPLMMWRTYWVLVYITAMAGAYVVLQLLSHRGKIARAILAATTAALSVPFALALFRPGLFTGVLGVTVLSTALAVASVRQGKSAVMIVASATAIASSQAWFPFHGMALIFGALAAVSVIVHYRHRIQLRALGKWIIGTTCLALILLGLLSQGFVRSALSTDYLRNLLGAAGGDPPQNQLVTFSILLLAGIGMLQLSMSSVAKVITGAALFASALLLLLAFFFEPYWPEYGPRKHLVMVATALIPLAVAAAGHKSLQVRDHWQSPVVAVTIIALWLGISNEPLHQIEQLRSNFQGRAWTAGMHTALTQYPGKRVVCIDTERDGLGYEAYDCSNMGLAIGGYGGDDRLFESANLCGVSPSAFERFDAKWYENTVILISDGSRLSSTTGCQERGWEVNGRPNDDRWLLGWVTLVRFEKATVLDFAGNKVSPTYESLLNDSVLSRADLEQLKTLQQ